MSRVSQLFQPMTIAPKDAPVKVDVSKSYKVRIKNFILITYKVGIYNIERYILKLLIFLLI